MYSAANMKTREKVFDLILHKSPCTAAQIGKKLNLTPAAVRRHLEYYEKAGDIEVKMIASSSSAGRPARHYVLTPKAQDTRGNDYLEISKQAITKLREVIGDNAVEEMAVERADLIHKVYAEKSGEKKTIEQRAKILDEVLTELDFASSVSFRNIGGHQALQLCQAHCPIQGLAAEFPEFCVTETNVFSEILEVDVRRLATLAQGSHVCTTHIPLDRSEA
ncbi:MAG: ArsR family transcriptional regulator [Micrococcaceae bacterium]